MRQVGINHKNSGLFLMFQFYMNSWQCNIRQDSKNVTLAIHPIIYRQFSKKHNNLVLKIIAVHPSRPQKSGLDHR